MDQQNQSNIQNEVTMVDIIKLFRGKLKTIICIALIAAILGAAIGVAMSFLFSQYGGTVKFYLIPGTKTQTFIQLMKSEKFAEELLLDENRLPENYDKNDPDYKAALAAVTAEREIRDKRIKLNKQISEFSYTVVDPNSQKEYERITFNEIESKYNTLVSDYDRIYNLLVVYKSTYSDKVAEDPNHAIKTREYEEALALALQARNEYRDNVYLPKKHEQIKLNNEYNKVSDELIEARVASNEAVEKVLSKWRDDKEVRQLISIIQSSVTYKYAEIISDEELETGIADMDDAKHNQNYSFLEISIAVDQDKEIAEFIMDRIKSNTPSYLERNIERLTATPEAKCTLISTFARAKNITNPPMLTNAVLFAAIAGAVAVVCSCTCIIVKGVLPPDTFKKAEKKNKKQKASE